VNVKIFGKSVTGRVRTINQDHISYSYDPTIGIICDGIGGHKGGEIASEIATEAIKKNVIKGYKNNQETIPHLLGKAFFIANKQVRKFGRKNKKFHNLGTTAICLCFTNKSLFIGHIGDSRCYLFYQNYFWKLTNDHNIAYYLRLGVINDMQTHHHKALVKAIGLEDICQIDVYEIPLLREMVFLTCSDGLSDMLKDTQIKTIINHNQKQPKKLLESLINEANQAGGRDNISIIVAKIDKKPLHPT